MSPIDKNIETAGPVQDVLERYEKLALEIKRHYSWTDIYITEFLEDNTGLSEQLDELENIHRARTCQHLNDYIAWLNEETIKGTPHPSSLPGDTSNLFQLEHDQLLYWVNAPDEELIKRVTELLDAVTTATDPILNDMRALNPKQVERETKKRIKERREFFNEYVRGHFQSLWEGTDA